MGTIIAEHGKLKLYKDSDGYTRVYDGGAGATLEDHGELLRELRAKFAAAGLLDEADAYVALVPWRPAEHRKTQQRIANGELDHTYQYAKRSQGFEGTYQEWLALADSIRDEYEDGAAGIPTA